MADRLGDMLVAQGVLDAQQLGKACALQKSKRVPLGEAVVSLGFADEKVVWRTLAKQQKLAFVDLESDLDKGGRIKPALIELVPADIVEEHSVLPVALKGGKLVLAVDDPLKTYTLDALQFVLNRDLVAVLATPSALRRAIGHYYGLASGGTAIEYCLQEAGLEPGDLDYVGFYDKPFLKFERLIETYLAYARSSRRRSKRRRSSPWTAWASGPRPAGA